MYRVASFQISSRADEKINKQERSTHKHRDKIIKEFTAMIIPRDVSPIGFSLRDNSNCCDNMINTKKIVTTTFYPWKSNVSIYVEMAMGSHDPCTRQVKTH
jgi:hypothetical protein